MKKQKKTANDATICFRVPASLKKSWEKQAKTKGMKLSPWLLAKLRDSKIE